MSGFWKRVFIRLQMRQVRQTIYGSLALLWYAFNHLPVLRLVPVNAVFQRQLFFTGVEALGIVAIFGLLSGALVITQITSLIGGDSTLAVKILIWTIVREIGPLAETRQFVANVKALRSRV